MNRPTRYRMVILTSWDRGPEARGSVLSGDYSQEPATSRLKFEHESF